MNDVTLFVCEIAYRISLRNCLDRFLHETADRADPDWITVFPLVHLMQGLPVGVSAAAVVDRTHGNDKWWAIEKFKAGIDKLKHRIRYDKE